MLCCYNAALMVAVVKALNICEVNTGLSSGVINNLISEVEVALHLSQLFFDFFSLQPILAGFSPFLPSSPTQVAFIISFFSKDQLYFFQIALSLYFL